MANTTDLFNQFNAIKTIDDFCNFVDGRINATLDDLAVVADLCPLVDAEVTEALRALSKTSDCVLFAVRESADSNKTFRCEYGFDIPYVREEGWDYDLTQPIDVERVLSQYASLKALKSLSRDAFDYEVDFISTAYLHLQNLDGAVDSKAGAILFAVCMTRNGMDVDFMDDDKHIEYKVSSTERSYALSRAGGVKTI
jgi:hypothetical protein